MQLRTSFKMCPHCADNDDSVTTLSILSVSSVVVPSKVRIPEIRLMCAGPSATHWISPCGNLPIKIVHRLRNDNELTFLTECVFTVLSDHWDQTWGRGEVSKWETWCEGWEPIRGQYPGHVITLDQSDVSPEGWELARSCYTVRDLCLSNYQQTDPVY